MTTGKYVLGFAFDGDRVALIRKNRPEWQAGKLNGIGSKLEPNESFSDAMIREFQEGTGQLVTNWRNIGSVWGSDGEIQLYATTFDSKIKTVTDEEVGLYDYRLMHDLETDDNLPTLVAAALLGIKYDVTVNIDYF